MWKCARTFRSSTFSRALVDMVRKAFHDHSYEGSVLAFGDQNVGSHHDVQRHERRARVGNH